MSAALCFPLLRASERRSNLLPRNRRVFLSTWQGDGGGDPGCEPFGIAANPPDGR